MPTCQKCSTTFPNRVNINGIYHNIQRRKYCLDCSPFGGHNTKKLNGCESSYKKSKNLMHTTKTCSCCMTEKPIQNFYKHKTKNNILYSICDTCSIQKRTNARHIFKQMCIEYLGTKCQVCGFVGHQASMGFHHIDPTQKEFNISHSKASTLTDTVKKELDKCMLLCLNCHGVMHFKEDF